VAGNVTVTTGDAGPTITYTATAPGAATGSGFYTFVVGVSFEDQVVGTQNYLPGSATSSPRAAPYEWADSFGKTLESLLVLPTITTKAQPTGTPNGTVQDTATVTGVLPPEGLDITFAGYGQAVGATTDVCTPATLAYSSKAPVVVMRTGDFPSEVFNTPAGRLGTIDWVETSRIHGTDTVVATGVCGDQTEQTILGKPTVTTKPPTGVLAGNGAKDTIIVNGPVAPGTTVVVTLYKLSTSTGVATCTDTSKYAVLPAVAITPGQNTNNQYVTQATGALPAGQYGFVETAYDTNGNVITTGGCLDEIFTVMPVVVPVVPATTAPAATLTLPIVAG